VQEIRLTISVASKNEVFVPFHCCEFVGRHSLRKKADEGSHPSARTDEQHRSVEIGGKFQRAFFHCIIKGSFWKESFEVAGADAFYASCFTLGLLFSSVLYSTIAAVSPIISLLTAAEVEME
jgi:hypothetical protein